MFLLFSPSWTDVIPAAAAPLNESFDSPTFGKVTLRSLSPQTTVSQDSGDTETTGSQDNPEVTAEAVSWSSDEDGEEDQKTPHPADTFLPVS